MRITRQRRSQGVQNENREMGIGHSFKMKILLVPRVGMKMKIGTGTSGDFQNESRLGSSGRVQEGAESKRGVEFGKLFAGNEKYGQMMEKKS